MFPLGDTPNPRGFRPYVTWALIGANVLVYLLVTLPLSMQAADLRDPRVAEYLRALGPSLPRGAALQSVLAQLSQYDLFAFAWGYKPGAPQVGDLFASLFLHGGFAHLAGNMLYLWIFGDNVEHRLGRLGFLAFYLATGVAATLSFALLDRHSLVPLVGASGAISGVLGAYFLLFPRNRVKVFVVLPPFFFDVVLLPARWVLGFFVLVDNLVPLLFQSGSGGVAYGAHLGGFFAGLGVAWLGEKSGWQWPWKMLPRPAAERAGAPEPQAASAPDGLRAAIASGDKAGALAALARSGEAALEGLVPAECVTLATWLDEAGQRAAAASLLRRCVSGHPTSSDLARVYLALGLMRLREGQATAAYQHLLSALESDPDPETASAARRALEQIDVYRRTPRGN